MLRPEANKKTEEESPTEIVTSLPRGNCCYSLMDSNCYIVSGERWLEDRNGVHHQSAALNSVLMWNK